MYSWASGTRYVGNWKNNKRNGHGKIEYADGRKYVGEWVNSK